MEKFVIIDGNNLMFRAFYALPAMTNFAGEQSNAVFGFANMLVKIIKEVSPKYIAVAFDSSKKTFRHEKYLAYKGTRKPAPVELISQFPIVKDMLKAMNITVVEQPGLEADDLMGCLSRMYQGVQNIIVSADRDAFQLINDNTQILYPKRGVSETITLDIGNIKEHYGVEPNQVVELKSLMGDSSDNIPGVSGVGEKKALQLIADYGSLDGVYENIDKITGKLKANLIEDKECAYLSHYLATIVTDKDLGYNLSDFEYDYPFGSEVKDVFKRYQFGTLLKKDEIFNGEDAPATIKVERIKVDNEEDLQLLVDKLIATKEMSIYIDNDIFEIYCDKEYEICVGTDLLSCGLSFDKAIAILKPILESADIKKIVYDYKALKHILYPFGVKLNGVEFDCVLARYLINSLARPGVTALQVFNENSIDTLDYAYGLTVVKSLYYAKLQEMAITSLYYDVEMPLVEVLFDMEIEGFKIDREELKSLEQKYREEIVALEKEIFDIIGHKFNLSSPKQLGEVLFDELGINIANNKKKSTSIEVLNEIEDKHPVVPLIIRWRSISKLYSTYIIGFEELLDSNDKIHTLFNQTQTSTGRLSSSEPNLQNIPIRTDEGRALRRMFVPSNKGGLICSADYSQIELRLLANLSGDEVMIDAYSKGEDIHRRTASEVFGVPAEMVDDKMRRSAKAINFGIVYGISDFGLSQNIGCSRKEAAEYIKLYFARYPFIEKFINDNVEYARANGYIKTMFGRIRPVPEVSSSNHNLRTFGERVAMNMPLQGTASDIIKLAMIKIYNEINNRGLKSKIIVQVHDELVVDVYPGELDEIKEILKTGMEGVVDLKVPMLVNIESGATWYEAK